MGRVSEKMSESEMLNAEATELIREIAEPVPVGVALRRVGEALSGWTANRIRDVFHADPRVRLDDAEIEQLRAAVQRKREAHGRAELQVALLRLDRARQALRALGSDLDI